MRVLLVRHAIAQDAVAFARTGAPDVQRPLTPRGRRRMRRAARGLKRLVPTLDLLATSPLVRATQTAEVLLAAYPDVPLLTVEELVPDQELPAFLRWLRTQSQQQVLAAVGHEPHLSHLASWLLSGRFTSFLELRKGAAVMLEFGGEPAAGEARLLWLLQPGQLRRISA